MIFVSVGGGSQCCCESHWEKSWENFGFVLHFSKVFSFIFKMGKFLAHFEEKKWI